MPMLSNVKLHMDLVADLESKSKQYIETGNDMKRKAQDMLAYAQCHCDHEWIPPHKVNAHEWIPPHKVNAHEGGVCKHCRINELHAADHRRSWLALEAVGLAPWGPRFTTTPRVPKALQELDNFQPFKQAD